MPKLNENQKSLIILGAGLAVGIGFGVLAYMKWGDTKALRETNVRKEEEKKKNEARIAQLKPLKGQFVAYSKIVADNSQILPTTDQLHRFLRDLGKLEADTGVTIKTLPQYTPAKDKQFGQITKTPLTLSLTGSTRNFLRFLNLLENRDRLVTVTEFRITPTQGDPKPGMEREHEANLRFETYTYDPPAAAAADAAQKDIVSDQERITLMETKEVRDIIEKEGKPAFLERYDLMRGREDRRDPFLDPRRRTSIAAAEGPVDESGQKEGAQLERLVVSLAKARIDLDAYRAASSGTDFLRQEAAKQAFLATKEILDAEIAKVSRKTPEFQRRDFQDRYVAEVKRPYEELCRSCADISEGGGGPRGFVWTVEFAQNMRKEMQDLVDARKFAEGAERYTTIEGFIRDTQKTPIPPAIQATVQGHLDATRKLGERARLQAQFAARRIEVQGVVRMKRPAEEEGAPDEVVSGVIVNGRILFPGKVLDRDIVFRGVEEDGRLVFLFQGREVDFLQAKPELLNASRAILEQE